MKMCSCIQIFIISFFVHIQNIIAIAISTLFFSGIFWFLYWLRTNSSILQSFKTTLSVICWVLYFSRAFTKAQKQFSIVFWQISSFKKVRLFCGSSLGNFFYRLRPYFAELRWFISVISSSEEVLMSSSIFLVILSSIFPSSIYLVSFW